MSWWKRLLKKRQLENRLQAELQFHFERQVADNLRAGMSEEEASRQARLQFGGMEQVKEECREARGTLWAETLVQDVRLALRGLKKSPGFTATVICTLALGIGANSAIFQLLDAVRLRSLPVKNPQELVTVQIKGGNSNFGVIDTTVGLSYPLWEQIRQHQQGFSGAFAWATDNFTLGQSPNDRRASGLEVSGDAFRTLGVIPAKGRLFTSSDDHYGCGTPGVVISYGLWQSEFGGRDSVIGKRLVVNGRPIEIIGVTPKGFTGLDVGRSFDFALPICSITTVSPDHIPLMRRDYFWLNVMGRVKPGWTPAHVSSELSALSSGLFEALLPTGYQGTALNQYKRFRLAAYPGSRGVTDLRQTYDTSLWLLLGMTGLVLLIACVNIANLLLARASAREREMAVRLALGASRWRLIRQLLTEGLMLAAGGAVLGAYTAAILSNAVVLLLSNETDPLHLDLSTDWRVIAFTAVIAIGTCLVFDLAPAFRISWAEPNSAMKAGSLQTTAGRGHFSFQRMLVVSQIAVSLVLLIGALLFVRSFWNLTTLNPGFREKGILLAELNWDSINLHGDRRRAFIRELLEQIQSIPHVDSAATSTHVPLQGNGWTSGVRVEGVKGGSTLSWVSSRYFHVMQIPILAGRSFTNRDTRTSHPVAIINQAFARKFFRTTRPIGTTIRTTGDPDVPATEYEVIGVVKDTKYAGLREKIPPQMFAPAAQFPGRESFECEACIFIRFSSQPSPIIAAVRQKVSQLHPGIPTEFHLLQTTIQDGLVRERLMALLSGFFGVLAVLLAVIGLYGVISYIVLRRRHEIGIRMALGATRLHIVGMVMREALMLVAIGAVIGIPLSLALGKSAGSLLFGLQPYDPLTLFAATGLLITVAVLASFWPAQRASRLSPMIALRYE